MSNTSGFHEGPSFTAFGGAAASQTGPDASFSDLFSGGTQSESEVPAWSAHLPAESPIVAKTAKTTVADLKTPGFIVSHAADSNSSHTLEDSFGRPMQEAPANELEDVGQQEPDYMSEDVEEDIGERNEDEEEEDEEADDGAPNKMFFNIPVSNRAVVNRKFKLASDRRAALKRKMGGRTTKEEQEPRQEFVSTAEALYKIQHAAEEVDSEEEDGEAGDAPGIMTFAPPPRRAAAPVTKGKTPNFATKQRSRLNKHDSFELDIEAEAAKPSKRYRSLAANRAAQEGGAVGVPMIPKTALTRPEEFDFATAARELAREGGAGAESPDVFEQAAADVRGTSNKIGMYVDLDGALDQDTLVAKKATTGKKRQPGRSRLPGMNTSDIVQPDFGDASFEHEAQQEVKRRQQQGAAKKSKQEHHYQQPMAALTVPMTPKFATTARAASKWVRASPSPARRPLQRIVKEKTQEVQRHNQHVELTVPKTPKFATSARAREPFAPREPAQKHQAPAPKARTQTYQAAPPPQLTVPKTPQFATSRRAREPGFAVREVEPVRPPQHQTARQDNRPMELTEPKAFSFATDRRAAGEPTAYSRAATAKYEAAAAKKTSHKTERYTELTNPKPFSFATNSRLGEPRRNQRTAEENAHPNSRVHHRQDNIFGLTEPQPFNLRVEVRGQVAKEVLEMRKREEEEELRQRANFRAKPFVDRHDPFPQVRSNIPLTQAEDFVLNSDVRAARRSEYEANEQRRRKMEAKLQAQRERERLEHEAQELREMRSRMVPRARPIRMHDDNPGAQKRAHVALTVPKTPVFATSRRFNRP